MDGDHDSILKIESRNLILIRRIRKKLIHQVACLKSFEMFEFISTDFWTTRPTLKWKELLGSRADRLCMPSSLLDSEVYLTYIDIQSSTASDCTHILTSQQLSGSKTHRILTTKMRTKVHVVKPEWVLDSVRAGKRKLEQEYSIIKLTTTRDLRDMLTT